MEKKSGILVELTDGKKGIVCAGNQPRRIKKGRAMVELLNADLTPHLHKNGKRKTIIVDSDAMRMTGFID